jgi:hypothetical protein
VPALELPRAQLRLEDPRELEHLGHRGLPEQDVSFGSSPDASQVAATSYTNVCSAFGSRTEVSAW